MEKPVPNVPAHEKYDDPPASKSLPGQALALNPYIVENPAGVVIRNLMPRVQLQFVILCAEGEGM
jgi:hypothetical protein